MAFTSFPFLVFFVVVFPMYWVLPRHAWRLGWLLLASCAFYLSWDPWLLLLLATSIFSNFTCGLLIEQARPNDLGPRRPRFWLIVGIVGNLTVLGFFKYANFFLGNLQALLDGLGVTWTQPTLQILLPLGISFYTFENISYLAEIHLGHTRAVRRPFDYALFILFFPRLVAGPIVRPHEFLPQLSRRKRFSWDRTYLGIRLFVIGLFKKAVLADHLATVADRVFKEPSLYGSLATWAAVLAYAVQIYCDFSGYSDMALGLAHLFGFKLPRNFNAPYLATSITDFWRRWHISLSTWLRDYLYVPLGGNRKGVSRTYVNLILVMLLGGLWHGASWTFVAWGLYHGILLALHRALPWPEWTGRPWARPLCQVSTFLLVCVGWVFFRAQTFGDAGTILHHMVVPVTGAVLKPAALGLVAVGLLAVLVGNWLAMPERLKTIERRWSPEVIGLSWAAFLILVLLLLPESSKTFIYFQF